MRQSLLSITSILLLSLFCSNTFAQNPSTTPKPTTTAVKRTTYLTRDTVKNTDPSLNGQYRFMLSRTRTSADGYKMVAGYRLDQLWKSVSDTLRKERTALKGVQQKLTEQEKNGELFENRDFRKRCFSD